MSLASACSSPFAIRYYVLPCEKGKLEQRQPLHVQVQIFRPTRMIRALFSPTGGLWPGRTYRYIWLLDLAGIDSVGVKSATQFGYRWMEILRANMSAEGLGGGDELVEPARYPENGAGWLLPVIYCAHAAIFPSGRPTTGSS